MFENDDWTFEDTFNDSDEKAIQSHFQYRNEELIPSIKRRKVDDRGASSFAEDNTFDLTSDTAVDTKSSNPSHDNKSNVSRRTLLLGIFQASTCQEISDFAEETNKHALCIPREVQCSQLPRRNTRLSNLFPCKESKGEDHIKSANKAELNKEVKLVRIFPGPAGLVAHKKSNDISVASYLNRVKELENKIATEHTETDFSKSQDEENLFGDRAWKFLVDDLPNNFLKGYEISTIKSRANASHCDSTKVKFIAGILDYIDHNHDDPFIILKDLTGSIEGTVHRDILLTYPGVLEPNVVILLYDVGLLKTTTYVVTNRYHILVSQVNLVAIYSNKGRIVCTSHMENILSSISAAELTKDYHTPISKYCAISNFSKSQRLNDNCDNTIFSICSVNTTADSESTLANDTLLHQKSNKDKNHKQVFKDENSKSMDKIYQSLEYSTNMDDDMNDIIFNSESEFITSDKQKCLDHPSFEIIAQNDKIQQCELQTRSINHLENMKEESLINLKNNIKKQTLSDTLQERVTNVIKVNVVDSKDKTCVVRAVHPCSNVLSYNGVAHKVEKNSDLSLKSVSPLKKCDVGNFKSSASHFTAEVLYDNMYDSDDEILSQLDV